MSIEQVSDKQIICYSYYTINITFYDWSLSYSWFYQLYRPVPHFTDTLSSTDPSFLVHEPVSSGDMAVRSRCVRARIVHNVCDGPFQPVRVEQPPPVPRTGRHRRESVQSQQYLLVYNGNVAKTRFRSKSKGKQFIVFPMETFLRKGSRSNVFVVSIIRVFEKVISISYFFLLTLSQRQCNMCVSPVSKLISF